MTHTPTPWRVCVTTLFGTQLPDGSFGALIGDTGRSSPTLAEACANAERIVACVNACAGIDTEVLAGWTADSGIGVKQQRDALMGAVERLAGERDSLFNEGLELSRALADRGRANVHLTAALGEAREERDREASVARELRRDLDGTVRGLEIRNAELTGTENGVFKLRTERDQLRAALSDVVSCCDAGCMDSLANAANTARALLANEPREVAIDDDTGAPVVLPHYIVIDGNAYWREPVGALCSHYLMAAPLDATTNAVIWDDSYECDTHTAGYDSILATLELTA